jgi:Ca2+-binding EF-hand superfamily protein
MYVDEDEQALVPKVEEKIRENQLLEQFDASNYISDVPLNDYKNQDNFISYSDFLKVLLEYQLRAREKFLLKFKHLFRLFDRDNNGKLNW